MAPVRIESLAFGGDGVAHLEDGRAVFVLASAPGDLAEIEIVEQHKTYARARISRLLEPGPSRVEAPCPVFGDCGGCQWQHLSYAAQLEAKEGFVRESLRRIGGIAEPPLRRILPSASPMNYRNKAVLPVEGGRLGFYAEKSHRLVPLPGEGCAIQAEAGNEVLRFLRTRINGIKGLKRVVLRSSSRNEVLLALVGAQTLEAGGPFDAWVRDCPPLKGVVFSFQGEARNAVFGSACVTLAGDERIQEELGGIKFSLSAPAFFQVNPGQVLGLWEQLKLAREWKGTEKVLELYCGAGTLSLSLARACGELLGVENFAPAVEDARANALLNGVSNVKFEAADSAQGFKFMPRPDLVVLDPPRKGMAPGALKALAQASPREVLYVSCDPASLARDAKGLLEAGYSLEWVQPLDMFPQTYHVESLSRFVKKA